MSHKLAYWFGKITKPELEELEYLKDRDPDEYRRREIELGATREALVLRHGEGIVREAEKEMKAEDSPWFNPKQTENPWGPGKDTGKNPWTGWKQNPWRTNRRTKRRFPVRR